MLGSYRRAPKLLHKQHFDAAAQLFVESGYGSTTLQQIAGSIRATVELTAEDGSPRCARVDPPAITWSAPRL